MKIYLLIFGVFIYWITPLRATIPQGIQDSITVYIFLHESCVISQYYTLPLRELHAEYANEEIGFVGLFPNFSSKPSQIQSFKEKYEIPFALKTDYFHTKTKALGATVTPEVIVVNEVNGTIIYQGRIDDNYAQIGRRKRRATSFELRDTLQALQDGQPILVARTEAVGCFIGKSKLE